MKQETKDRIKEELNETKEEAKNQISEFFCWEPFSGMGWFGVILYIILLPIIIIWIVIRTFFQIILP